MNMRWLTGGEEGFWFYVPPIFNDYSLLDRVVAYYFVLLITIILVLFVYICDNAPFGKAFHAIKDNEDRAEIIGYNTTVIKLISFTLSGFISCIAGGLYAFINMYVSAYYFYWTFTAYAVLMTLVGGAGTIEGVFIGAFFICILRDIVSSWSADYWPIVLGIALIIVVLTFPHGFIGYLKRRLGGKMI
jgi:branched-chain amino acid transport system permease protein